jgi:hypothetical protein
VKRPANREPHKYGDGPRTRYGYEIPTCQQTGVIVPCLGEFDSKVTGHVQRLGWDRFGDDLDEGLAIGQDINVEAMAKGGR